MRKVFVYPSAGGINLYKKNIIDSFNNSIGYIVSNHKGTGEDWFNLYKNLDADIYIFSWPENLCVKFTGFIKFLYLALFVCIFRVLRKKVVWIMHNKHPHKRNNWRTKLGMKFMASLSSAVITHSREGVRYGEKLFGRRNIFFIPHPVYSTVIFDKSEETIWDYIIWGTINRRKKILEFFEYINDRPFYSSKKILLCGTCTDAFYEQTIKQTIGSNVTYYNRYIADDELKSLINKSKTILFTYANDSILSSGALIYSINFCKPIIGPYLGAFKDLEEIVSLYKDFSDIETLKPKANKGYIEKYIHDNQWKDFPSKIEQILYNY